MSARTYSTAFLAALAHVLAQEGGFSNHAEDPGGTTFKGVTLKLFRQWRNNKALTAHDLAAITPAEVQELYHDLFWRPVRGDELPAPIALMTFDAAVNSGVKNAGLALQRAIARYSPFKLAGDGVVGPQTVAAAQGLDQSRLVDEFASRRMWFYGLLIRTFLTFGLGWSRRLMAGVRAANALIAIAQALKS